MKRGPGKAIEFSREEQDFLIANYRKISLRKLGDKFACSPSSIRNFYINRGLTKSPGPRTTSPDYVICKCPKCEKLHTRKMPYWNGTIPARKFCMSCGRIFFGNY